MHAKSKKLTQYKSKDPVYKLGTKVTDTTQALYKYVLLEYNIRQIL